MELADIVKCNRLIIPVFVHVNPVDVQKQEGTFGSLLPGFTDRLGAERVNEWKEALRVAGNAPGFTLDDDRNEAELIRKVVKKISLQLRFYDEGMRRDLNGRERKTAEPSSSSLPSRTIDKPRFDVFLSFSGKDTWKGFTGHIYNALIQRGISTFIDSKELERGERIEELFNYIEASKIFVPVLSKEYADSRWCLREITKRVECGRLIIPIFLGVPPAHVRRQEGPFGVAFQWHKSCNIVGEEDLNKWKEALRAVGEIKGYKLQNNTNGNEAELIRMVVKQISLKLELPLDDEGMKRDLNGREQKTAEPSSSSLPSRTIDKPRFDVFLSFSGKDTRKGFTGHLYNALIQRGISTFIDSKELEMGERIEKLFNYIEASKIFVPVLSKGYAHSSWCLREITKMVECGRLIITIFFDVDPRDVRKQSGPFELDKGNDGVGEEDLSKWKVALGAVGKISGYSLQNDTNGNEADLIQNVVEQISSKLNKNAWPFTEHLVGMDSHIDKMYRLLDLTDKEVKMIGIVDGRRRKDDHCHCCSSQATFIF
ncbi:TMV resistance protein [Nymphaea thermarum]|nr:TMV resistance protein [Nymphaea thermarum]